MGKSIAERFWAKVDKDGPILRGADCAGPCWIWCASRDKLGYGRLSANFNGQRFLLASRLSWAIHRGHLDADKCVLHRCDNPTCVNPEHLFLGTRSDNSRDCWTKRRAWFQKHPEIVPHGESHHQAKLTIPAVRRIREMWAAQAARYGVKLGTIIKVVQRKTWKHI